MDPYRKKTRAGAFSDMFQNPLARIPFADGGGGLGKLSAALALDCVVWFQQEGLMSETLDALGIHLDQFLMDSEIFGWMFVGLPDLTTGDLMTASFATISLVVAILCWVVMLDPQTSEVLSSTHRVQSVARPLLSFVFAAVLTIDFTMVFYRAFASNSVLMPKTGIEMAMMAGIGVLTVCLTVAASFLTAACIISRAQSNK